MRPSVCVLSCVQLFATPWTVTHQAPPPTGFSRQESWSGLPCHPPGDLPNIDRQILYRWATWEAPEAIRVALNSMWLVFLWRRGNWNRQKDTSSMLAHRRKTMWGHSKKTSTYKPRREVSEETSPANHGLLASSSVQFSLVTQSCPTLCDPMNYSTPGLPVHHQLLEFTQTHVHRVGDAIQPSHPLSSPSPPAPSPSQHQSLFQWVNTSHEVAKVLEFQL